MAKNYKLMKVTEGQYNVRQDDNLIGHMNYVDGKWNTKVFGFEESFKTKIKAQGFVRGVCVATDGQTDETVYTVHEDESSDCSQAANTLVIALDGLKEAIENFSATL